MHICDVVGLPTLYHMWWIPALLNEALLASLALYKGIRNLTEYGSTGAMQRFTIFLVKDSMLYFFA